MAARRCVLGSVYDTAISQALAECSGSATSFCIIGLVAAQAFQVQHADAAVIKAQ